RRTSPRRHPYRSPASRSGRSCACCTPSAPRRRGPRTVRLKKYVPQEEVIVPFPAPASQVVPVSSCRGTLIASSLRALESTGRLSRYFERLAPSQTGAIQSLIAGQWITIDTAVAHYEACDRLELNPDEQMHLGGLVADRIQKTFLATVMKLANES